LLPKKDETALTPTLTNAGFGRILTSRFLSPERSATAFWRRRFSGSWCKGHKSHGWEMLQNSAQEQSMVANVTVGGVL
jgi:hypothetical protein